VAVAEILYAFGIGGDSFEAVQPSGLPSDAILTRLAKSCGQSSSGWIEIKINCGGPRTWRKAVAAEMQ
jgi:hypothetical protein